jgi:chemotaxis protein methyltransferase CheR
VRARLLRRLKETGLPDFASYADLLESPAGGAEQAALAQALTTNVTHFFREAHHFRLLADHLLAGAPLRRLRLWSAGCSAGPEPYSMAMTLLGDPRWPAGTDLRVLATDIDPSMLDRARAARYPASDCAPIPPDLARRFLGRDGPDHLRVSAPVRAAVHVAELNLMGDWPVAGPFNAIFCRNVAIYFDRTTQARLWSRFADLLAPGGLLCIGHAERLSGPASAAFRPAGLTAHVRVGPSTPPDPSTPPERSL